MGSMVAIGLMSGTSRDGIDAALIETDGEGVVRPLGFIDIAYTPAVRELIAQACGVALTCDAPRDNVVIDEATRVITLLHVEAVRQLLRQSGHTPRDIELIGFHGHTVAHRPDLGWTWQIGDARILADACAIDVIHDFRSNDVAAGGEGAPLIPIYHAAMAAGLAKPALLVNLGGIANITYIGNDGALVACDTGMANALIDDWTFAQTGAAFDNDGALAARGRVDQAIVDAMLDHPYFDQPPPKSLDRDDFSTGPVRGLSPEDGAATLTAFSAQALALTLRHLPDAPAHILVAGGGRKNSTLMAMIEAACGVPVTAIDTHGWNGDATEAEGFAYMAVRHVRHLPISFPRTTGVPAPVMGGIRINARRN